MDSNTHSAEGTTGPLTEPPDDGLAETAMAEEFLELQRQLLDAKKPLAEGARRPRRPRGRRGRPR